jgi:hypothetical protein
VRLLLYGSGTVMLALAGAGVGLLAWVAGGWTWYAAGLPLLWFLLAGGWALLGVTSEGLYRLRVGHAVAMGGLLGVLVQAVRFDLFSLGWAVAALTGGLVVAWKRRGDGAKAGARPGSVRPPLTRRG